MFQNAEPFITLSEPTLTLSLTQFWKRKSVISLSHEFTDLLSSLAHKQKYYNMLAWCMFPLIIAVNPNNKSYLRKFDSGKCIIQTWCRDLSRWKHLQPLCWFRDSICKDDISMQKVPLSCKSNSSNEIGATFCNKRTLRTCIQLYTTVISLADIGTEVVYSVRAS